MSTPPTQKKYFTFDNIWFIKPLKTQKIIGDEKERGECKHRQAG